MNRYAPFSCIDPTLRTAQVGEISYTALHNSEFRFAQNRLMDINANPNLSVLNRTSKIAPFTGSSMKMVGARTPKGGQAGDSYGPAAGIAMPPEDAAEGQAGVEKLVDFMLSNAKVPVSLAWCISFLSCTQISILLTEHARILNYNVYKSLVEPMRLGVQGVGSTSGTLYSCKNYMALSHRDDDGTGGMCSQWGKPPQLLEDEWSFGYFKWRVAVQTQENMIW